MKIVVALGIRPHFIKQYSFQRACRAAGIDDIIIHTGQHYDRNMSFQFFDELGLRRPDYTNDLLKSSPSRELAEIMTFVEGVLYQEKPDVVVVYGDVTSTLAAALASVKVGVPTAHVEAGVRCQHWYNPEEVNRRATEAVAHTLLAHTRRAEQILLDGAFPRENVFFTGDLVKDSLDLVMAEHDIKISNQGYALVTVHRAENTDNPNRLANICQALIESGKDFFFPVHPRTRKALERFNLLADLERCDHIHLLEPQGYIANIKLLAGADRVASDSGGLRREAYILSKPVIALTDMIWAPEVLEAGWKWVADADKDKIIHGLTEFTPPDEHPEIFGKGDAAERIVSILTERYGRPGSAGSPIGLNNKDSLTIMSLDKAAAEEKIIPSVHCARKTVSVVTPCYNEEDGLPTFFYKLDYLRQAIDPNRYRLEYVLVNDGSTDRTGEMLERKYGDHPLVSIVHNERNYGFGGALKVGLNAAQGDVVVTIDADTNYDVLETPNMLEAMVDGVDMVTGSPFAEGGEWNYPFHRYIMSQGVVWLYRYVLREKSGPIQTFTCGFRAYRKEILDRIWPEADDFLATAEMLIRALLNDMKVIEYPTVIYDRKFGKSKLKTVRTMRAHLGFMYRIWLNKISPVRRPFEN